MADDFLDRFFGRRTPVPGAAGVANPQITDPLSLQLLLDGPLALDAVAVTKELRGYDTDMTEATAELFEAPPQGGDIAGSAYLGLLAWKQHVVKLVGFNGRMPTKALEACMLPAHYPREIKSLAYAHKSHALLYYAGYETDPLEQYVALAAAAGALTCFGASFVLNEEARTALRAGMLRPDEESAGKMLATLRELVLLIYCGISKLEVEGTPGVWMRTYGAHRLNLPDLAYHAPDHSHGSTVFELFTALYWYLRKPDGPVSPGHTVQIGGGNFLRLRTHTPEEWFLKSNGELLVVEPDRS